MSSEEVKRKLAAILSADVEGYSRLMSDDEIGTIRTLSVYRDAMTNLILLHRGRVVDAPGDNLLAEFASVVDAVQCAVEIQRDLAERNQEMPENKRMHFRIGVNLGDVVEEEDRIYGDGVNIAARMESLCEGGSVCISGTAFEHVENKLDLEFEDLGEHEVKNITKPVRVYRVLSYPGAAAHRVIKAKKAEGKKWRKISFTIVAVLVIIVAAGIIWNFYLRPSGPQVEAASVEKMALPLPDKPSIAVLPFVNMSGDPEQEYFSDGITENIITDLSKISGLLVISRSSTFAYKGKPIKISQVAEEFGVRYVLEGSVQKDSDRIRINAQLIDAITGHHLWAERYDRDLKNIFALQDEIRQKIVMTLRVEVTEAELERIKRIPTENLTAYESALRGVKYLRGYRKSTNVQARQMFERAIELDPGYAAPYVGLGWTYLAEWLWGWTQDPQAPERAFELVQKAINLDDSYASAHRVLGVIYLWKDRQHEQAIAAAEKATSLDSNHPDNYSTLAEILKFSGRPEEVIELMEKAMRLNPRYPGIYLFQSGSSYYYMERYDEAIPLLKRAVTRRPNHMPTHQYLAASYTELGREEEARAELAEVLRISPNHSLEGLARYPYKDPAYLERLRNHMRKAGLK
jgi:TolB-like protein/class 3 adenylate cyclase